MIMVHGNRFVQYHVYRLLDLSSFDDPAFDITAVIASVPSLTTKCSDAIIKQVQAQFPAAYTNSLFNNATKCKQMSAACLLEWNTP